MDMKTCTTCWGFYGAGCPTCGTTGKIPDPNDLEIAWLYNLARRWYKADGTFEELEPEEVVRRRKAAAVELAGLESLRRLAQFGLACFQDHRNAGEPRDLDGGWLQELAERHELLEPREMDKPCGDDCACAAICDFPTTCYCETPGLKAARAFLQQGE